MANKGRPRLPGRRRLVGQALRDREALALRTQGHTLGQIAEKLVDPKTGKQYWRSTYGVHAAIDRALLEIALEDAEALRVIESTRLDSIERKLDEIMRRDHYVVSSGTGAVVRDPETGRPLIDDAPVIQAANARVKLSERRSKLLGLDAPARSITTVVTVDQIDANIRLLESEIERRRSEAIERQAAERLAIEPPQTTADDDAGFGDR